MRSAFLVENLCSGIQFPDHTIAANEEASDHEVERLADGRRSVLNYWTPTTVNQVANVTVTCDRVRAADMLALDRGHTLAGKALTLQVSDDGSTYETLVSVTLPDVSGPGDLDDDLGVVTEEGAWLKRFPLVAALYWRLEIAAVASYVPQIVGLWIGKHWSPIRIADTPWDEDGQEAVGEMVESSTGWMGSDQWTPRRSGSLAFRLDTSEEYDQARYHILGHYARRRPMWIVPDVSQAERALLAIRPQERLAFPYERDWWRLRRGSIVYLEHEPLLP